MNTQTTEDRADQELRALLAQVDPERGQPAAAPTHLLDRVLHTAGTRAQDPAGEGPSTQPRHAASGPRPSFLSRHWQGALLAAATVATLALAAPTVLPGVVGGGDDASVSASDSAAGGAQGGMEGGMDVGVATDSLARESEQAAAAPDMADGQKGAPLTAPGEDAADQSLVRYGSLLVGTEDVEASRNAFVATVLGMGGRITSETVVTEDSATTVDPYAADAMAARDMGMSYPYPWYPTGPGIWLSVQVPAEDYDEAIEAARSTGEVIQMQQSSYDVGSQKADVDARIEALEASLARLTALMGEAKDISDVIALEQAISQRQSELDSLRAQQRDLANQTAMSQISLTLMSPDDARQTVDPQPDQSWWESFLEGLGQFWAWLGSALLIVSPLLLATAIIWWVRRRRARRAGTVGAASAGSGRSPSAPGAPAEPDAPTSGE